MVLRHPDREQPHHEHDCPAPATDRDATTVTGTAPGQGQPLVRGEAQRPEEGGAR